MPPQNTHEEINPIFQKELELFREKSKKLFTRGGLCAVLDYPPHHWVLDEKEVESFLLSALRRASMSVVEAKIKEVEKEKEILEKVLLKATMPGNIAIYEEKIETIDDVLGILNSDTLATAKRITGE